MSTLVRRLITVGIALLTVGGLVDTEAWAIAGSKVWAKPQAFGNEVTVRPDGSLIFIAGGVVTARDPATGSVAWSTDAGGGLDQVAVSPDGSMVFASGQIQVAQYDANFLTVAFDAGTGEIAWSKTYDGPVDAGASGPYDADIPYDVEVTSDGTKVFVTGVSDGLKSPQDFVTIGYDASDGAQLWKRRYSGADPGAGDLPVGGVALNPTGTKVFVSGESYQGATRAQDFVTVAYSASSGTQLWMSRFGGTPVGAYDTPHDSVVAPNGRRVFVAGGVQTDTATGYGDIGVVAYRTRTGERVWAKRVGDVTTDDGAESVAVSPDGSSLFVTGFVGLDVATVAFDPVSGSTRWLRTYDGPGGQNDMGSSIASSADGSTAFVTGLECADTTADCGGGLGYRYVTIAYAEATGQLVWVRGYSGPTGAADSAYSIAASPLGEAVFVTGSTGTLAYST